MQQLPNTSLDASITANHVPDERIYNMNSNPAGLACAAPCNLLRNMFAGRMLFTWSQETGLRIRQACLQLHVQRQLQERVLHVWNVHAKTLLLQHVSARNQLRQHLSVWRTAALICSLSRWALLGRALERWNVAVLQNKLVKTHLVIRTRKWAARCLQAWRQHAQAALACSTTNQPTGISMISKSHSTQCTANEENGLDALSPLSSPGGDESSQLQFAHATGTLQVHSNPLCVEASPSYAFESDENSTTPQVRP
jgi:hypothetical protein